MSILKSKTKKESSINETTSSDFQDKNQNNNDLALNENTKQLKFIPPAVVPDPGLIYEPEPIWKGDPDGNVGAIEPMSGDDEFIVEKSVDEEILTIAEVYPEYPGGKESLIKYLHENIRYPEDAKENNIQGKVYVQFVVFKDGHLADFKILKGVYLSMDREALRTVSQMPNWIPGKNNGKDVNVRMVLPVNFWIQ